MWGAYSGGPVTVRELGDGLLGRVGAAGVRREIGGGGIECVV